MMFGVFKNSTRNMNVYAMTFKTVIVYYHYDVYVVCIGTVDSFRRTSVTSYATRGELNE